MRCEAIALIISYSDRTMNSSKISFISRVSQSTYTFKMKETPHLRGMIWSIIDMKISRNNNHGYSIGEFLDF